MRFLILFFVLVFTSCHDGTSQVIENNDINNIASTSIEDNNVSYKFIDKQSSSIETQATPNMGFNFNEKEIYNEVNTLEQYKKYDFSELVLDKRQQVIGILGNDNKRLIIKVDYVQKISPTFYEISGESKVNTNVTKFNGKLTFKEAYETHHLDYGVDNEYLNQGLSSEGIAIFDYKLEEDKKAKYSGVFNGQLYLKFYKTNDERIHYDDINIYSDSYFNRLYDGSWTEYGTETSKIASWADYTLPKAIAPDLNIGVGEFVPNPKYYNYGWLNFETQD